MCGIVLFADGSARPNPGHAGWGIHGYIYSDEEPKKGTGLGDTLLTNEGYFTKLDFEANNTNKKKIPVRVVTPISYVDGYGNFDFFTTNNVAELTGIINCLKYIKDSILTVVKLPTPISEIRLITDSEYVVRGTNEFIERWKTNGWKRQDGSPVANKEVWQEYSLLLDEFEKLETPIPITLSWVKGHAGHLGNVIVDEYAAIATTKASRTIVENNITLSKADGYWKYEVEKHPFISHRRMYFNTLTEYQVPGQYYLGEHGKDDDLLGAAMPDGAYSFIAIEPDTTLELVRTFQSDINHGYDGLVMARLDCIFGSRFHKLLSTYGTGALIQPKTFRIDLCTPGNEPVTRELRPPKLAIRAIEALSNLSDLLAEYESDSKRFTITDVTNEFFDITTVTKGKKDPVTSTVYKLKNKFVVGIQSTKININYLMSGEVKTTPVTLTFNIDLPNRNSIKRMEPLQPKMSIITWKESDKTFRYALVISAGADRGIWAGVYSNLVVTKD